MDTDQKIVEAVSLPSGAIIESPRFEQTPSLMVLSRDGATLLVFERGSKSQRYDARVKGPPVERSGEPTSLTFLDAHDLKRIARIKDVGWNAKAHPPVAFAQGPEITAAWEESGKILTILAWGKKDRRPELVQLDVPKARFAGRYPLASETDEVNPPLKVSNNVAAVLYGNREDKKGREGATSSSSST
jgi:hypothetical protein